MYNTRRKQEALRGTIQALVRDWRPADPQTRVLQVAERYYAALDTPLSRNLAQLCREGRVDEVVATAISPADYETAEDFASDAAAVAFLKKCPVRHPGLKPDDAARSKYFECEEACRSTNLRFRDMRRSPLGVAPVVHSILASAQRKIAKVLGDLKLAEVVQRCRFGPGTNLGLRSAKASVYEKLTPDATVTHALHRVASVLLDATPGWTWDGPTRLTPVRGNAITFVPKDARTSRPISIEPIVNTWFQLGTGDAIRWRLRGVGINLNDQTQNQLWAEAASITQSLATVDLSSASDTIAIELVRELFPQDWFNWLSLIRSPIGSWDTIHGTMNLEYEKFSSMGNGSTFEVETLIFWALAKSVTEWLKPRDPVVSVYGDDIVVAVECVELLTEIFTFCGLTLNREKSFSTGCFRESCGKDFWDGHNVRPYYQKELLSNVESYVKMANGILGSCVDGGNLAHRRQQLLGVWRYVVSGLPRVVADHLIGPPLVIPENTWPRTTSPRRRVRAPDTWIHMEFWDASQRSAFLHYKPSLGWSWLSLRPRSRKFYLGDCSHSYSTWLYEREGGSDNIEFGEPSVSRRVKRPRFDVVIYQSCIAGW